MTSNSSNQDAGLGALKGQHHHKRTAPAGSPKQHYHQCAAPEVSQAAAHRRQDVVVSADIIRETHRLIDHNTVHDVPLSDLSSLTTRDDNMCLSLSLSLSLSTEQDSTPQVAPFLDPGLFETRFNKSRFFLDPTIIHKALPLALKHQDNAVPPGLYYGNRFFSAYKHVSGRINHFYWDCIDDNKANNPDLCIGGDSLAPMRAEFFNLNDTCGKQLNNGQRDSNGELIWKVFSGFCAHGLESIIMGSRANCQSIGEGTVLKSELLDMLLQLRYVVCVDGVDVPQVVVINLTNKYARIVQGTFICPNPNYNDVDFRISVSEQLQYVDEKTDTIIPDFWKRLLSWTFCRAAKAKRGNDNAGDETTSAVPEENDNLIVSKIRERKLDDKEEEALRIASKSTVASLRIKNKDMSAVDEQDDNGRRSPASSSSSSQSP
ncbi:hypothetical protein V502_10133 [Pseudogymnoascus sp. VKM F-4520 (FW-2644)]|nr:hypothetical protein V502_10133 [Pseudogymnoascus sp. VKM F-4520 (FW-2644)]